MSDQVYHKLAKVLDTLPNGFPATEDGLEIRLLKKIFSPEEADLFCDLKLTPETAEQISERTGRPLEYLEKMLPTMWERGEIMGSDIKGVKTFNMVPWVIGVWEFQLHRMDKEFARMSEEYSAHWGAQFLNHGPQIMQVIPIEKEIQAKQEALHYEQISSLIEKANSFMVNDCVCKKEKELLDNPCSKPLDICLAMNPEPGYFDNSPPGGRIINREQAYEVLNKAEEAGLVHLTTNVENGHWFICNCCGCCCGILGAINMGFSDVINSHYYAAIDSTLCDSCGTCADERCQVNAIEERDEVYSITKEKCIGCGLCISTCPSEAIELVRKDHEEIVPALPNEDAWLDERARQRGVDYSQYK